MNKQILNSLISKFRRKRFSIPIKPFSSIKELPIQLERKSGIHQIKTNPPIDVLSKYGEERINRAHYNF